jgi:cysteinyl-tRNA synthetase
MQRAIYLWNTLGRQLVTFEPKVSGEVGLYTCGPTVYGRASIGNMRAYVFSDVLRRMFLANGYKVNQVVNITDVGHLVGDGNEGEDKVEVGAKREGKTAWDVAREYTDLYLADIAALNVLPATHLPKATDHIGEQIAMIEAMEAKGFTYLTADGVYFDTAKLPSYGELSGQKLADKVAGARVEVNDEKRNPTDFALWKFSPAGEKRQMEWPSPWGVGFPGWHIECSAMSEKYLGLPFDIHTGGEDHVAVHHENEIAQARAARGVIEANVWLHNAFLTVDGGKMSKSLGNVYSIDDLREKGFEPRALRYLFLTAHYRTTLNFTWEALEGAQRAVWGLEDTLRLWPAGVDADPSLEYVEQFLAAINNDLDTPNALAVLHGLVSDQSLAGEVKAATVRVFEAVLGLGLSQALGADLVPTAEVAELLGARAEARGLKDFGASDVLRGQIEAAGFRVLDTPQGQRLLPVRPW